MDTHPPTPSDDPTLPKDAEQRSRPADPKVEIASAEPKIFGMVQSTGALVLGAAARAVGIGLLLSGSIIAGVVFFVCGAILLALSIDAARRWPASALPRVSVRVVDAIAARLGLARTSAGAWAGASREVIGLRREQRELRPEREAQQFALGEAAYREEAAEVETLRERLHELDEQLEGREKAIDDVKSRARTRVERERVAIEPTQQFAVPEEPAPPGEDDKTRETPTEPRPSQWQSGTDERAVTQR